MTELERKLIIKIRTSNNPEKLMDYIEELLITPQCQEALEEPSALPVI